MPIDGIWQQRVALALLIARLCIVIALLPFAIDWRSPLLASHRPVALLTLIAVPLLFIATDAWALRRKPQTRMRGILRGALLLAATAVLVTTLSLEVNFHWVRARVFSADTAQVEKLGRHFVVGYRHPAEIDQLVDLRAIGGVFIGARNVAGLSADAVRTQIDSWQDTRGRQGLPPLLIATDQEGGAVSRLSPPLPRQPPLSSVVEQVEDAARRRAAHDYGLAQGRALANVGVNLNFAPVVDLNRNLVNPNDRYTRIRERAIAGDPAVVVAVARQYCMGLREAGVHCTLKHFPGLGGVFEDTHLEAGHLRVPLADLEGSDWIPFRSLMGEGTFTMLSHARLSAIDAERPVSAWARSMPASRGSAQRPSGRSTPESISS